MAEPDTHPAQNEELFQRLEDDSISRECIETVTAAISADNAEALFSITADLHEADFADLLVHLSSEQRSRAVHLLGDTFDFTVLTELDAAIRGQILEYLEPAQIARGLLGLDSDDAVFLLEDLDEDSKSHILRGLPIPERRQIERSLDYPEESAGRRMQNDFIAIPPFWTVGQTIDYLREDQNLPEEFYQIFVINARYELKGTVQLDRLLRSQRPTLLRELLDEQTFLVHVDEDQEEVAHTFQRYNLLSLAVVDESSRLVGVIMIDDIVDIIRLEADEDIKRLGGVGDEEISDRLYETFMSRLPWLGVNLVTAVLASLVIGLFDTTIDKMVSLAILMPIVASMGGNAGTQTMTVAVRALANRDLGSFNVQRIVLREAGIGLLNGVVFAVVIGLIAAAWFDNAALGIVIGLAMIVNMFSAGLSGIMIPIVLNKMRVDPAVASSTFVTTVTDVIGFFAFLFLARLWFAL